MVIRRLVAGLLGALIAKVAPGHDDFLRRIAVLLVGVALVVGGGMWLQRSRSYMLHGQNGVVLLGHGKADEGIAELQKSVSLRPDFAPPTRLWRVPTLRSATSKMRRRK